jgi:mono/diheme cytochrome c family protein
VAGADSNADLKAIGEGRALYLTHCASCHGHDASGLTGPSLASIGQRDRAFSRLHAANHIQGRRDGMASAVMPAWGAVFSHRWPKGEGAAALKTAKLVRYLEFVQAGVPPSTVASGERR